VAVVAVAASMSSLRAILELAALRFDGASGASRERLGGFVHREIPTLDAVVEQVRMIWLSIVAGTRCWCLGWRLRDADDK